MVSHDAIINSAAISGSERLRRELSFAMGHRCEKDTAGDEAARRQAYTIPTRCPAMAVRSTSNRKERRWPPRRKTCSSSCPTNTTLR
jgi:hypothetical protein